MHSIGREISREREENNGYRMKFRDRLPYLRRIFRIPAKSRINPYEFFPFYSVGVKIIGFVDAYTRRVKGNFLSFNILTLGLRTSSIEFNFNTLIILDRLIRSNLKFEF